MRKVLSFVLVLSLVLGSFGMAFAATPKATDVKGLDCEDAVKVLSDLGVVSGYADGTYKPANIVTRGEMAALVVKALGLNDYATGASKFKDMKGHWADKYVAYANTLGIISGYPDGTFKANATVSYDEAATMAVKALGYTDICLIGTWPANYVTKAKSLGILENIKAGATGANRGDIAVMLYQTLDKAIGAANKDNVWVGNAKEYDNDGKVTAYDTMLGRLGAKLYSNGNPFIVTDNIAKDDAAINLYPYIGAYITAYQNSDKEIIAVKEVKSTFIKGSFDKAAVGAVTEFTADADDVDYTLANKWDVAPQFKIDGTDTPIDNFRGVFENAELQSSATTTMGGLTLTDTFTIAAEVSGKTIKKIYSISQWDVTDKDLFEKADATDISEDNTLLGLDFPENNDRKIDTNAFELIGVDSLDKIAVDNVVYVYGNGTGDKNIARVAVGTEVITGKITKISSDKNDFTIDGKVYSKSDDAKSWSQPKVGNEIKARLDAYGDIYSYDKLSGSADKYAVVLDLVGGTTGFSGDAARLNLFLADGTDKPFDVKDDITGVVTKSGVNVTISGIASGDIIKYSTDKNGKIDDIVTMGAMNQNNGSGTAVSPKGYYDKHQINKDAVIFTYDAKAGVSTDADDYGVASYDKILDSDKVDARYVLDDDKNISSMVIDDFTGGTSVYGLFTGWGEVDGDYDFDVDVLINGKEESKMADSTAQKLAEDHSVTKSAIVYKLKFDGAGAVTGGDSLKGNVAETTYAAVTLTTTGAGLDGNKVLDNTGKVVGTLDDDAIVYTWDDKADKFLRGNVRDIKGAMNLVDLYDVLDDDGVFDLVVVVK